MRKRRNLKELRKVCDNVLAKRDGITKCIFYDAVNDTAYENAYGRPYIQDMVITFKDDEIEEICIGCKLDLLEKKSDYARCSYSWMKEVEDSSLEVIDSRVDWAIDIITSTS